MKSSWKLGTFAGIGVYVHITFPLLLGWVAYVHWKQTGSVAAVVDGVAFILSVFACIVLHEFGHALTARRYGVKTRNITLLPIGGVAWLERIPEKPSEEFMVAIMGPAVNIAIAGLIWIGYWIAGGLPDAGDLAEAVRAPFLLRLMAVNVFIVLFNAIPAFPMDGGRVLRALLATRMDRVRATQIAAALGRALAVVFAVVGLLYNPLLILIAVFVWMGATSEAAMVSMKSVFGSVPVRRVMQTEFHTVSVRDTLAHVADLVLAGSQKDFPVVENGEVVGLLTEKRMIAALTQTGRDTLVGDVMERDVIVADVDAPLTDVFQLMQQRQGQAIPVTSDGRLVGLLTLDNIGEFHLISTALRNRR